METNNDLENELRAAFPDLYDDVPPVSYDIETGDSDSLENEEVSSGNSIIGNNEVEEAEYEEIEEEIVTGTPSSIPYQTPYTPWTPAPEDNVTIDPLDLNTPEEEDIDANTSVLPPIDWSGTESLGETTEIGRAHV